MLSARKLAVLTVLSLIAMTIATVVVMATSQRVYADNGNTTINCNIPLSVVCTITDPDGIRHVKVVLQTASGPSNAVDKTFGCEKQTTIDWNPVVPNGDIIVDDCRRQVARGTLYDGLVHTARGNARLALVQDTLVIDRFGTSDGDGVNIQVADLDFWEATLAGLDPSINQLHLRATGKADGAELRSILDVTARQSSSNTVLLIENNGLAHTGYLVKVLRDTTTMADIQVGGDLTIELNGTAAGWCNPFVGCRFEFWRRKRQVEESFTFSGVISMTIGGRRVEGNRIEVIPLEQQAPVDQFGQAVLTATGAGKVVLAHEQTTMPAVGFAGLDHMALGDAMVAAHDDKLIVDGIGASGEDGVSIDLGAPAREWDMTFAPDMQTHRGGRLQVIALGQIGEGPSRPISTLQFTTNADSSLSVAAMFDTDTYIMEIYNGGTLVARKNGLLSNLDRSPYALIHACGNVPSWCCDPHTGVCGFFRAGFLQHNDGTCEFQQIFASPAPIMLEGKIVYGDKIRLYETPQPSGERGAEFFDEMRLLATNVGTISIADEFVTPRDR